MCLAFVTLSFLRHSAFALRRSLADPRHILLRENLPEVPAAAPKTAGGLAADPFDKLKASSAAATRLATPKRDEDGTTDHSGRHGATITGPSRAAIRKMRVVFQLSDRELRPTDYGIFQRDRDVMKNMEH
jgi:hypothetical protein